MRKKPVAVTVYIDEAGKVTPRAIVWPDGREFPIAMVHGVENVIDPETGQRGQRYTVCMALKTFPTSRCVYRFGGRWYIVPGERPEVDGYREPGH